MIILLSYLPFVLSDLIQNLFNLNETEISTLKYQKSSLVNDFIKFELERLTPNKALETDNRFDSLLLKLLESIILNAITEKNKILEFIKIIIKSKSNSKYKKIGSSKLSVSNYIFCDLFELLTLFKHSTLFLMLNNEILNDKKDEKLKILHFNHFLILKGEDQNEIDKLTFNELKETVRSKLNETLEIDSTVEEMYLKHFQKFILSSDYSNDKIPLRFILSIFDMAIYIHSHLMKTATESSLLFYIDQINLNVFLNEEDLLGTPKYIFHFLSQIFFSLMARTESKSKAIWNARGNKEVEELVDCYCIISCVIACYNLEIGEKESHLQDYNQKDLEIDMTSENVINKPNIFGSNQKYIQIEKIQRYLINTKALDSYNSNILAKYNSFSSEIYTLLTRFTDPNYKESAVLEQLRQLITKNIRFIIEFHKALNEMPNEPKNK
jgi:hypothetical protein